MTTLSRRSFLAATGLGVTAAMTGLGTVVSAAPIPRESGDPTGDRLLVIFLAGGTDGLTLAPPYGYSSYREHRPTIAVPGPGEANGALELTTASSDGNAVFPTGIEGVVGLHPSLKPIHDTLWKQGRLAVMPMIGLPGLTRSHFSAQKNFHHGGPVHKRSGGWLGRAVQAKDVEARYTSMYGEQADRVLAGTTAKVGLINSLDRFALTDFDDNDTALDALTELYRGKGRGVRKGARVIQGVKDVAGIDTAHRAGYPRTSTGRALSEVATLFTAFPGIRVASMQVGGWDHHSNMGAGGDVNGRFSRSMGQVGDALRAFSDDTELEGITVMVLTEFGRTINENGSGGSDHGVAATFMAMGAGIQGGVFGDDYPDELSLNGQARADSPIETDFRKVAWDILDRRFGVDPSAAFPDYRGGGGLGLVR